jgi:hypothetical protein
MSRSLIPQRHAPWETGPAAGEVSADARARGRAESEQTYSGVVHMNGCTRSTVEHELALRPGFSLPARMPSTALRAPRGERLGLLVLTAGPVRHFYGRYPPARWTRPDLIDRAGVLALFLPHDPDRGTGRLEDHDAHRRQLGGAQARRVDSRSRIAAALAGNRCPTTPEHPASGRPRDQGRPGRSERSPLRVPDAIARLVALADGAFRGSGVRDASRQR